MLHGVLHILDYKSGALTSKFQGIRSNITYNSVPIHCIEETWCAKMSFV